MPSGEILENGRRSTRILIQVASCVGVGVGLVCWLAAGLIAGLIAGVSAAVIAAAVAPALADRVVRRLLGAEPADPARHARLMNLVDGLRIAAGVPMPELQVVADLSPNACSIGRDPRHATLVVTEGLVSGLSRIELEGVLAHEISHVKRGDTRPATLVVAFWGIPGLWVRSLANRARRAAGPQREVLADLAGVRLTRYPPGLIAALQRIDAAPAAGPALSPATASLWIRPPGAAASLGDRIETLREL